MASVVGSVVWVVVGVDGLAVAVNGLVVLIGEVGICGRRLRFRVDPDTDLFGNGLV